MEYKVISEHSNGTSFVSTYNIDEISDLLEKVRIRILSGYNKIAIEKLEE
jgi:hypothetical protein